jgi:hypothetical protein
LLTTLLSRDIVAARRGKSALAAPGFDPGIIIPAVLTAFGKTVSLLVPVLAESSKLNPQKTGFCISSLQYSHTPRLRPTEVEDDDEDENEYEECTFCI